MLIFDRPVGPVGLSVCLGRFPADRLFDRKPAAEKPWTEKLRIYDLRTNKHFTLKGNPLKRSDLDDLESPAAPSPALRVACYNPKNRHERKKRTLRELHL
jgi:type I restriction enzyme M protein